MIPIIKRSTEVRSGFLRFEPGLNSKLLLIVAGVTLIGVLASSIPLLALQRRQLIHSTQAATARLSDAIEASLEHAMETRDWALASQMVRAEVGEQNVETIRILNVQGVVRASSISHEVGEHFDQSEPSCQFCHANGDRPGNQTALITLQDGREALLNVNLIRNRPRCAVCHDPRNEVLGFLMIEMPLTDLRDQLAAGFSQIVLFALITSAVLVGLMFLALRRLVIRPVGELAKGVAEIGAGNLDHQVHATSHDELGALAQAFDAMRRQLNASRAKMERHNQELAVLNEVGLAATQMLDLQQILDLALDTVVNTLGMQGGLIYLLDEELGRLTLRARRGISEAQCRDIERRRQQPHGDLSQRVAHTGETIFVTDMAASSRFQELWDDLRGRSYVNIPMKSKGAVVGTMGLVTHAGQPLAEREVEVLKVVGQEIGIAIDNVLLLEETRRREQEAATLYQLGTQISSHLELQHILDVAAEGARTILRADIGVMGLLDEEHQEILAKAFAGARTEILKGMRLPVHEGSPGSILALGQPFICNDCQSASRILYDRDLMAAEGIVSTLTVPLRHGERLQGMLGVMSRQRRRFSQDDVRLLARLAHPVVVAIENARLYQQMRHLTALEERDLLAREIHDHLAQSLGYLNVKTSITDQLLSAGQIVPAQASLLELKEVAKETYTDVREAIFNLRTIVSPGLGFLPTLREYLAEYRTHYGVDAKLVVDDESLAEFPADVAIQITRIIKEALTNVRKHANATRAWVRLKRDGDGVKIIVEDNGQGFDPAQAMKAGRQSFGLQIMGERAASVGVALEIDTRPNQGARVVIRVPSTPGEQ